MATKQNSAATSTTQNKRSSADKSCSRFEENRKQTQEKSGNQTTAAAVLPTRSKRLGISAKTAAQSKLLPCGRMLDMQRTLVSFELFQAWTSRTVREIFLGRRLAALVLVMARIAKVRRAKTEKHSHAAAVATLVLQKLLAMLATNLGSTTTSTEWAHELGRVKFSRAAPSLARSCATKVRLLALEAGEVGVLGHGISGTRVLVITGVILLAVILKPHQCLASNLVIEVIDGLQQRPKCRDVLVDP